MKKEERECRDCKKKISQNTFSFYNGRCKECAKKQHDSRDCPKCGARMDSKGSVGNNGDCLWQCPKCNNIELLWEDS